MMNWSKETLAEWNSYLAARKMKGLHLNSLFLFNFYLLI